MQLFSFLSFFCMFHTKEQSHKRNYIHIIRLIDFYIIPLSKWNRDRIKNAIGAVSMQQNYERNKIEFVNSLFYTHNEMLIYSGEFRSGGSTNVSMLSMNGFLDVVHTIHRRVVPNISDQRMQMNSNIDKNVLCRLMRHLFCMFPPKTIDFCDFVTKKSHRRFGFEGHYAFLRATPAKLSN